MREHVVVIPCDTLISVDGERRIMDFSAPAGLHALQWHKGRGHVEYVGHCRPNLELSGQADYELHVAPYVRLWEAENARNEAARSSAAMGPGQIPDLAKARADALAALATRRWRAEAAGIELDGVRFATDRDSRALIAGACAAAHTDPTLLCTWKTADADAAGFPVFVSLDADALRVLSLAVCDHVQECFSLEAAKSVRLSRLTSVEEIAAWLRQDMESGWPG